MPSNALQRLHISYYKDETYITDAVVYNVELPEKLMEFLGDYSITDSDEEKVIYSSRNNTNRIIVKLHKE